MTDATKSALVHFHNYYRNQFAIQNVTYYSGATRMETVQWDDELARIAELHVRSCPDQIHDPCLKTGNLIKLFNLNTISMCNFQLFQFI